MKIAIYPGSFDPITNGHMDILQRALKAFDKVVLLLAVNPAKKSAYTKRERLTMMRKAVEGLDNVTVDYTEGSSVQYAKEHGSNHIIRGLRAVTDFEYEFQLAAANHFIDPSVDMVFFMAGNKTSFISSSSVNELFALGADVSSLVPSPVFDIMKNKKRE